MKKGLFRKIFEIISNVLMILIFVILICVIFIKFNMIASGNNYFLIGKYSFFYVATGSMEPVIKKNDIIIVKNADKYEINDIVTYKKGNDFITHRIISINNDIITTKGDANNALDNSIGIDKIVGKVVKVYHDMGIWQKILTTPSVVIMIFITLVLFDFTFSFKGFKRKKVVKNTKEVVITEIHSNDNKKEDNNNDMDYNYHTEVINLSDIKEIEKLNTVMLDISEKNVKTDKNNANSYRKKNAGKLNYTTRLDFNKIKDIINDDIK